MFVQVRTVDVGKDDGKDEKRLRQDEDGLT